MRPELSSSALIQIPRDRRGLVIAHLDEQRSTGKIVARDVRGLVVARGDVLAAYAVCP